MSILGMKEKKVSFTLKIPQWFYDNLVTAAKGDNVNRFIMERMIQSDPSLGKKENVGFKKMMESVRGAAR